MAYPVVQSWNEGKSSGGVSVDVTKPSGVQAGDLLIGILCSDGKNETHGSPESDTWTDIYVDQTDGAQITFSVWYKIATGSEPSTLTFSCGSTEALYAIVLRIDGQHASDFIHKQNIGQGSTTPVVHPSVTTTEDECLILRLFCADHCDITVDSGWASATNISVDCSDTGNGSVSGGAGRQNQASLGSTGTEDCDLTANEEWIAITLAIRPTTGDVSEPVNLLVQDAVPYSPTIKAGAKKIVNLLVASAIALSIIPRASAKTTVGLLDESIVPYATITKAGAKVSCNLLIQKAVPYSVTIKTSAVVPVGLFDMSIVPYITIPKAGSKITTNIITQEIVPYATTISLGKKVNLLNSNIILYSPTIKTSAKITVPLLVQDIIPYSTIQKSGSLVAVNLLTEDIIPYAPIIKTGANQSTSLLIEKIIPYAITPIADIKKSVNIITQNATPYALTIKSGALCVVNLLTGKIVPFAVQANVSTPGYVTSGLVCYWKLDEMSGNFIDFKGNVDLTAYGSPSYNQSGKKGTAVRFYDDSVTRGQSAANPSVLMSLSAFTIEFTIFMYSWEDFSPFISGVMDLGYGGYYPFIVRFGDSTQPKNRIQFIVTSANGNLYKQNSTFNCQLGTWYHIVCGWDDSDNTMLTWINGQSVATPMITSDGLRYYPFGDDFLVMGCNAYDISPNRTLDGTLDEFRFYNKRLTQAEVTQNYNYVFAVNVEEQVNLLTQKIAPFSPAYFITPPASLYTKINKSKHLFATDTDLLRKFLIQIITKRQFKTDFETHEEV